MKHTDLWKTSTFDHLLTISSIVENMFNVLVL